MKASKVEPLSPKVIASQFKGKPLGSLRIYLRQTLGLSGSDYLTFYKNITREIDKGVGSSE